MLGALWVYHGKGGDTAKRNTENRKPEVRTAATLVLGGGEWSTNGVAVPYKNTWRKPRLIIYNVPEEIKTENLTTIIRAQNREITLNGKDIVAKFRYKTRKGNYETFIEVGPQTRKQILQTKLKIGWEMRNVED
jgi:hypothetical protein